MAVGKTWRTPQMRAIQEATDSRLAERTGIQDPFPGIPWEKVEKARDDSLKAPLVPGTLRARYRADPTDRKAD